MISSGNPFHSRELWQWWKSKFILLRILQYRYSILLHYAWMIELQCSQFYQTCWTVMTMWPPNVMGWLTSLEATWPKRGKPSCILGVNFFNHLTISYSIKSGVYTHPVPVRLVWDTYSQQISILARSWLIPTWSAHTPSFTSGPNFDSSNLTISVWAFTYSTL